MITDPADLVNTEACAIAGEPGMRTATPPFTTQLSQRKGFAAEICVADRASTAFTRVDAILVELHVLPRCGSKAYGA